MVSIEGVQLHSQPHGVDGKELRKTEASLVQRVTQQARADSIMSPLRYLGVFLKLSIILDHWIQLDNLGGEATQKASSSTELTPQALVRKASGRASHFTELCGRRALTRTVYSGPSACSHFTLSSFSACNTGSGAATT